MTATTNDNYGISSSTTTITTPSLGSFSLGSSSGSASYMYDEEVPQAYEQVSDGKDTMANKVGDFMDNNSCDVYITYIRNDGCIYYSTRRLLSKSK